jgi:hypothetical protein
VVCTSCSPGILEAEAGGSKVRGRDRLHTGHHVLYSEQDPISKNQNQSTNQTTTTPNLP